MKEEELHTLMNNKVTEGKEHKIAYSEIQELIASQKLFDEQKREIKLLNTIIRNQDKDIEKLKKNLAKKQKTSFLKGLGQDKILKARENLRELYKKYVKELYDITTKIDKFLEEIQKGNEE